MNTLILLPILIPFTTAIIALFFWQQVGVQRIISVIGAAALFIASVVLLLSVQQNGIQATQLANWEAPFGIVLVADIFSAVMVVMAAIMGFAVSVYGLVTIDRPRESYGYYPLVHLLLMGICGSFLTGDMFNLFVWFEVMLISSFVLIALGGERPQMEGAIKYVTMNLLASTIFLLAIGMTYGLAGTLNMADLSVQFREIAVAQPGLVTVLAMLYLTAFGIKSAIFPYFFWLPASYHTPPISITVIFAGLLTKVGVYAMIRVFTLLFLEDVAFTHTLLLVLAGFTMVTGVLGAVAQNEMRRLLSFHIVSQIGYLLMGLGIFTQLSLAGAVFFMAHVIVAKSALFMVGGVAQRLAGSYELKYLGGLYRTAPLLAILFLVSAFSLAGLPPFSGFWAKYALVRAGLEAEQYVIAATGLAVGLLTLFSMTKIWGEAFWKEPPESKYVAGPGGVLALRTLPMNDRLAMLLPIAFLTVFTVVLGLAAEPFIALSIQAADQLLNPSLYIQAVLGT